MAWPYQFLDLSEEEKHSRRVRLDIYAQYAQYSAMMPIILFLIYHSAIWITRKARKDRRARGMMPTSPTLKARRQSRIGVLGSKLRKTSWWLGDHFMLFGQAWGTRDEWIYGSVWALWLLALCVLQTGHDYMHVTKRFGIIAISQFPIHYLMSLKSLNPFAWALGTSHEEINRWHRVLGRIIYLLLFLHATLYVNYYVQLGILLQKLVARLVFLGMLAFASLNLLTSTALKPIRQYSYRLFFLVHVIVAFAMPPLVYFHAHSSRPAAIFMAESVLVFVADLVSRKLDTVMAQATLEAIPGTNLLRIVATIPFFKIPRFQESPGSHIYLSIPAAARTSAVPASLAHMLFELLFNPFTVAAVNADSSTLTLVARQRNGPMTAALSRMAARGKRTVPLAIEGPYGAACRFVHPLTADFDRVLLVAGGVGATFTLPLYRAITAQNPVAKVTMVWAVRDAGDATWATVEGDRSLLDDDNVHIFLTGNIAESRASDSGDRPGEGSVELRAMQGGGWRQLMAGQPCRRPNLKTIVDDAFSSGLEETVAVLACGPDEMMKEVRRHVGVWVGKGRSVWWHNESFAW